MPFFALFLIVLVDNTRLSDLHRSLWCREPILGTLVLRPSGSGACPFVWLELLGDSAALGMMARLPSVVARRSPLEEELDLGEDSFGWPHPMRPNEALFVVDDAAERATREVASWIYEGA